MNVEYWWNNIGGKIKELGEKSVPVPLWTEARAWASAVTVQQLTA
jgi:hypothetical protein